MVLVTRPLFEVVAGALVSPRLGRTIPFADKMALRLAAGIPLKNDAPKDRAALGNPNCLAAIMLR